MTKFTSTTRRAPGFTIVEVMMASVILVVGFIGMIEAMGVSSTMMDTARRQVLADQIINHHIEKLRLLPWDVTTAAPNELCLNDLPTASTQVPIDCQFWPSWNNASSYVANSVVSYNGAWYRCIVANSGQSPPNATYWTSVTSGAVTDIFSLSGATYTLTRTVTSPDSATNLREVNFTVTWMVQTSRRDSSNAHLTFTYTRKNSAYFGKYGLNLTYQRS